MKKKIDTYVDLVLKTLDPDHRYVTVNILDKVLH
jgi:hypothetical protein